MGLFVNEKLSTNNSFNQFLTANSLPLAENSLPLAANSLPLAANSLPLGLFCLIKSNCCNAL